uniref:hypothetical protein n=1 Tax=Escherichia coli TaxID=562 RepID=UPI003D6EDDBA
MDNMISDMDNAASEFVTTFLEKKEILATEYCRISRHGFREQPTSMNALYKKSLPIDNGEQSGKEALKSYLTTYGWVTLGAWYQTFATANQRLAELADRAPAVTSMSSLGEVGDTDLFSAVMGAYKTQLQNSTYTPTIGTITTQDESNAANSTDPQSVVMKSIAPTILKWTNQAATEWSGTGTTSNQVNPLIKMKKTSAIIHWVQQKFSGQDIQLSEFSRQWVITLFSERLLICSLDYLKDLLLCWMLQLPNIFLVVPVVLCGFFLINLPTIYTIHFLDDRHWELDSKRINRMHCRASVGSNTSRNIRGQRKSSSLRIYILN